MKATSVEPLCLLQSFSVPCSHKQLMYSGIVSVPSDHPHPPPHTPRQCCSAWLAYCSVCENQLPILGNRESKPPACSSTFHRHNSILRAGEWWGRKLHTLHTSVVLTPSFPVYPLPPTPQPLPSPSSPPPFFPSPPAHTLFLLENSFEKGQGDRVRSKQAKCHTV